MLSLVHVPRVCFTNDRLGSAMTIFLALIAILPSIAHGAGITSGFEMFFGGTSLLIMVGVVLDTLQQIETYLLNRHMDGLMEGTRVRGRQVTNELSGF